MRFRAVHPNAVVKLRRSEVARQWQELRGSIRSETGVAARTVAWLVGIAGVALGLELSRRWLGRREGRPEG